MAENKVYKMKFCNTYPLYVAKAQRKNRQQKEVDEIICWLTGYTDKQLQEKINSDIDMETFFRNAPNMNPNRHLITGSICGVKISEVDDEIVKEVRYLDKLVDELAKGKAMEKILRK